MAIKLPTVNYIKPNWEKDTTKDSKEILRVSVKDPKSADQRFLLFHVNVTSFKPEQVKDLENIVKKLQTLGGKTPLFLKITRTEMKKMRSGETFFNITCVLPDKHTINKYHVENQCLLVELNYYMINLAELYEQVKILGFESELSVDDVSLVHFRRHEYPFPLIAITPYAFIKAYLTKLDGGKVFVHKPFFSVFEYFDELIREINNGKRVVKDICIALGANEPFENMLKHPYIVSADKADDMNKFRFEDLKIEKVLGVGGCGAVMKVTNNANKTYALKQAQAGSSLLLHREAYVMNCFHNPNIVPLVGYIESPKCAFDMVKDKGKFAADLEDKRNFNPNDNYGYLLMEFCPHGDLEGFIAKMEEQVIPIDTLNVIVGQLLSAIYYIHDQRIVHRDLKPENVLIYSMKDFPWIKMCDFGISRSNDTFMRSAIGSQLKVDPSVYDGKNYNNKTELFGIGAILYFLVFKKYPSDGIDENSKFLEMMQSGHISFDFADDVKVDKEIYEPIINLIKYLLSQCGNKETIDRSATWKGVWELPYVQTCVNYAEGLFKKYHPRERFFIPKEFKD